MQRSRDAIRFPAIPASIPQARSLVAAHLTTLGLDDELVANVRFALTEATANVVRHAYRSEPPGDFGVEVALYADRLVLLVSDDGVGLSPHFTGAGLGMGLPLMSAFAEKLEIEGDAERGTTVRMTFSRSPALVPANSANLPSPTLPGGHAGAGRSPTAA